MNLSISLGNLDAIARGLREAPEFTQRQLLAVAKEATGLLVAEWAGNLPSVSGVTRKSIIPDAFSTPAGVLGVVGSSQESALWVEEGIKPSKYQLTRKPKGFVGPPRRSARIEALSVWAMEALGVSKTEARSVAFLVARKIAREGTEAKHTAANAADAMRPQIVGMFEAAAENIVRHLNGGAA